MSSNDDVGLSEDDMQRLRAAALSGRAEDLLPEGETLRPSNFSSPSRENGEELKYGSTDETPTPTRERVLNAGEFERLLIGASRLDGDQGLEAWSSAVILGRLGLRGGELTHFQSTWVDFRERVLKIPAREPCSSGQDGGICGSCKQAVEQRQRHGDDREFDEIAAEYWQPKTETAVRDIPFEWSPRAQEALAILIDLHGEWPFSFSTLQRRLGDALEASPGLGPDTTTLHGLRGTAASFHAGNGLDKEALKAMMGWRGDQTPKKYLRIDGQMTRRALAEVYS